MLGWGCQRVPKAVKPKGIGRCMAVCIVVGAFYHLDGLAAVALPSCDLVWSPACAEQGLGVTICKLTWYDGAAMAIRASPPPSLCSGQCIAQPVRCACKPGAVRPRKELKRRSILTWCHSHAHSAGRLCAGSALLLPGHAHPARALLRGRPHRPDGAVRASEVEAGRCPRHRCRRPCHSCSRQVACVSSCQENLCSGC